MLMNKNAILSLYCMTSLQRWPPQGKSIRISERLFTVPTYRKISFLPSFFGDQFCLIDQIGLFSDAAHNIVIFNVFQSAAKDKLVKAQLWSTVVQKLMEVLQRKCLKQINTLHLNHTHTHTTNLTRKVERKQMTYLWVWFASWNKICFGLSEPQTLFSA